jgi:AraC-like DNA-binding protein
VVADSLSSFAPTDAAAGRFWQNTLSHVRMVLSDDTVVRLHHAHQDLLAGVRPPDTVTAIAARWGFMHTGRFAALYRRTYSHSPNTTLRGDDGFRPWLQTGT